MSELSHDHPLHLPDDLHYECVRCGQSCIQFEEIYVEPERVASIRDLPPDRLTDAPNPRDPLVESPWTPGDVVMRFENGRCCMLTPDNLCAIHKAFGSEAKPNACRSFPYRFVDTPGGLYAGLSFSCTSVLADTGPRLNELQDDLRDLSGWTLSRRRPQEPFLLATELPLSWEQYLAVEEDLTALLDPSLGSLGHRLMAQSIYLRLLTHFLRQGRTEAGVQTQGPEAHDRMLEVFRRSMRGEADPSWARLRALAGKPRRAYMLRRSFLRLVLALRGAFGQRRGRWGSYLTAMSRYVQALAGCGRIAFDPMPRTISHGQLRRIGFDPGRPEAEALLARYFRHCLFRKDLLLEETIPFAHHLILMRWGLLHWASAAHAAADGADCIEQEHLVEGLRHVERFYGFHSPLGRIFGAYPFFHTLMARLLDHPMFVFAMGHGEWETPPK